MYNDVNIYGSSFDFNLYDSFQYHGSTFYIIVDGCGLKFTDKAPIIFNLVMSFNGSKISNTSVIYLLIQSLFNEPITSEFNKKTLFDIIDKKEFISGFNKII